MRSQSLVETAKSVAKLAIAAQYLQFLGTDKMSAEDISKEFYKMACSFNVRAENEFTTVTIEGLQENFGKAITLFEYLLKNCNAESSRTEYLSGMSIPTAAPPIGS